MAEGILIDSERGVFTVVDSAWANLENQLATDANFGRTFELKSELQPLSPFISKDFRVGAHAVLPNYTVYGPDGSEPPANFDNWNIDPTTGFHYVPVTLFQADNFVKDPRAADNPFLSFDIGTVVCQFDKMVGESIVNDTTLAANPFVNGIFNENINTQIDFLSPSFLVRPYDSFDGSIDFPPVSTIQQISLNPGRNLCYDVHSASKQAVTSIAATSGVVAYEARQESVLSPESLTTTNLILQSNNFSESPWINSASLSIKKSFASPYGGIQDATFIGQNKFTTLVGGIAQSGIAVEQNENYTFSFHFQPGYVNPAGPSDNPIVSINLGDTITQPTPPGDVINTSISNIEIGEITDAGSTVPFTMHPTLNLSSTRTSAGATFPALERRAWYRGALTFNSLNNNSFTLTVIPSIQAFTDNGFIIHGFQLEKSPPFPLIGPTPYVETLAEAAPIVQKIEEALGWDVAIAASGTTVAATAPLASPSGTFEAGLIRTYEKNNNSFVHSNTLLPPDFDEPASNLHGRFGHSVDLNAKGDVLLATAPFRTPPSSGTFAPSMYGFGKYDIVADFTSGRAKAGTSIYDLDIDGGPSASSTPWEVIAGPPGVLGLPPSTIGPVRVINKHPDWFNSAPVAKWIHPASGITSGIDPFPSGLWEYKCTFDLDTTTHEDFVLESYFGADDSVEDI
ncbi:MAG TPA: hypothetical protein EYN55_11335, partial [Rhodospirillales bacterium]|nr:hypothetical protein [Rhodospirillales bacterium]